MVIRRETKVNMANKLHELGLIGTIEGVDDVTADKLESSDSDEDTKVGFANYCHYKT